MSSTRLARRLSNQLCNRRWLQPTRIPPPCRSSSKFSPIPSARPAYTLSKPTLWFKKHWDDAKRDYPTLLPVSLIGAIGVLSILGLFIYDEVTRVAPQYSAYPDAVEQRLRYALHLTHVQADPDGAAKYFGEALKSAYSEGMDPFGKEVMGIRIRWAEMLERFGRAQGSIELLDGIVKDCQEKLAELNSSSENTEEHKTRRTALLRSVIQIKVKTAAIYESEYLQDPTSAKTILSDAVGMIVRETKDPQTNGFSGDNAAGLSLAEVAAILSQMGDLYATTGEEANAVQVYMLTLAPLRQSCNGTKTCKEVQILSNIASTMTVAMKRPGATINGKTPTKASMQAARKATLKWAEQAIATAENVKPEDRDQMCEIGLISAEMTKADLLLEDGQKVQSRELFQSLLPRLREQGLHQLVGVAEDGLQKAG